MYKILIVDDEEMIRNGIKAVIPWNEIEIDNVELASSAKEGLALIRRESPDILLTDISMTKMSGLDMVEEANTLCNNMKVIVLTGYDSFEYAKQALKLRVDDFLLKPIAEDALKECIWKQVQELKESGQRSDEELRNRRVEGIRDQQKLEKVLQNLLHHYKAEALELIEQEYHYSLFENMAVAILVPACYSNSEAGIRISSEQRMIQLCMEYVDVKKLGISFWDENGNQIVVALYSDRCSSDGVDVIRNLAYRIRDELGYMPRTAIGSVAQGMEQLKTSYQEAVYMIENEQKQFPDILLSQSLRNKSTLFRDVYNLFLDEMNDHVQQYVYVMRVYDAFCKAVKAYNLSDTYVQKCCFNMASQIYFTCLKQGGSKPECSLEMLADSIRGNSVEDCCVITGQFLTRALKHKKGEHELIERAKIYIDEKISEEISVSALAVEMNVSLSYFSRLFKKVTGEGCNEYIMRKRMEKAKVLLDTTNFDTSVIAGMTGYNDSNYFSVTFKKYYGMSPTRYRNTRKG